MLLRPIRHDGSREDGACGESSADCRGSPHRHEGAVLGLAHPLLGSSCMKGVLYCDTSTLPSQAAAGGLVVGGEVVAVRRVTTWLYCDAPCPNEAKAHTLSLDMSEVLGRSYRVQPSGVPAAGVVSLNAAQRACGEPL